MIYHDAFKARQMGDGARLRIVYDDNYQSEGSYALDTEEETAEAVREEQEGIESGRLAVLAGIIERRCPTCGHWETEDSLWGIVVETKGEEQAWRDVTDCMGIDYATLGATAD